MNRSSLIDRLRHRGAVADGLAVLADEPAPAPTPPVRSVVLDESMAGVRRRIVQTVNRFLLEQHMLRTPPFPARLVGARQIQEAVHIARQNRLVDDATLVAAGFRGAR